MSPSGSTPRERLAAFLDELEEAREALASRATLIVVTKFHPASLVRELFDAGQRDFGESRHQEAGPKVAELDEPDAVWHFVGQLQSKKARQIAQYAHVLHAIDSESVVQALERRETPVRGFVQVNLTDDAGRGGVQPAALEEFVERVEASDAIDLQGLMAVAPLGEPARPAFARLRELSERIRTIAPEAASISAGMSGDWREALEEGATHLRIGTAITGNRPDAG